MTRLSLEQYKIILPLISETEEGMFFNPEPLNSERGLSYFDENYIDPVIWEGHHTKWNTAQMLFSHLLSLRDYLETL